MVENRFLLLLTLVVYIIDYSAAWKPIASLSNTDRIPVEAVSASSYSLQQAYPGRKNTYSFNAFDNKITPLAVKHDLYLEHTDQSAVVAATKAITFSEDDHYKSYILETNKQSDLSQLKTTYGSDPCSVKKFALNYDGIVQYNNDLPELNQFTICFWMRFTNHSGDHVLFTYSNEKEPRELQIWVANSKNSSFLSMAIKGQQMYRLNYPLRMRKWHHMCSSWNGKTGEWQVWLKAERIGRGFHNSLVGYKIQAKGKLRSGGPSITGEVSQGLHFEITLMQIYRVALSAGKAHRNHKHHHAHHFDYEGQEVSTTARVPPARQQSMHSLLASGQIPTRVRINLANSDLSVQNIVNNAIQKQQHAITINTNFVNGQINTGSRLVAQQLLGIPVNTNILRKPIHIPVTATTTKAKAQFDILSNSANVEFIDETESHIRFKRQTHKAKNSSNKTVKKRGLLLLADGSLIDDDAINTVNLKHEGLAEFGDQQFKDDLSLKMNLEKEVSTHDREPAEEEVKAVMALCDACELEPFQGAIIFAWKNVQEHMNNALKGLSVGKCSNF